MLDCITFDGLIDEQAAEVPAHVAESLDVLRDVLLHDHAGRVAVVSSFGAESAVLLALVAEIDPATPVIFVDTRQHFRETLAYRDTLVRVLGLTDVRSVGPDDAALAANDPGAELWRYDPDACCALRKVSPLERALAPFDAWITGRKRHQAATRVGLPVREASGGKMKVNPLAGWSAAEIELEMRARGLPRHALSTVGYPSIGCAVCTRAVAAGEDPRSGAVGGDGKGGVRDTSGCGGGDLAPEAERSDARFPCSGAHGHREAGAGAETQGTKSFCAWLASRRVL